MQESLIEFPCDFPVKVMGRSGDDFESAVIGIVRRHVPDLGEGAVILRPSRNGNFTAMTFTIRATSRAQLDALYGDLTACDQVVMAL